ncbi:DUF3278 domain-containing protein [Lactobacillus sp. Marseille-P7033]|nr:DUF3278 domain-containing protein [Lactobacillus sp. Marseille-P7033]NGC78385.1 DUF3278 domain-containing protein [Limosilactobacillus reuteri]
MNNKLLRWFYNISEPLTPQQQNFLGRVSFNIAVMLFIINIVLTLLAIFIVTVTNNYEFAFNILMGALLLFTVFCVGGYSLYMKRQLRLHNTKTRSSHTAITNYFYFHTSIASELRNPMNYIVPIVIGILYGLIIGIITWYKNKS